MHLVFKWSAMHDRKEFEVTQNMDWSSLWGKQEPSFTFYNEMTYYI